MSAQVLYRFRGAAGELLYVGITADVGTRWKDHAKVKPWWHLVASVDIEHFPDRTAVVDAERRAIQTERPIHNVVHNRRHDPVVPRAPHWFTGEVSRWPSVTSNDMPDCCAECRRADLAIGHPCAWVDGTALYVCQEGHAWLCGWGHGETGVDPRQWRPALHGVVVADFRQSAFAKLQQLYARLALEEST